MSHSDHSTPTPRRSFGPPSRNAWRSPARPGHDSRPTPRSSAPLPRDLSRPHDGPDTQNAPRADRSAARGPASVLVGVAGFEPATSAVW